HYHIPTTQGGHRALADIRVSIQELKYYREVLLVNDPGPTTAQAQEAPRSFELREGAPTPTRPAAAAHAPWLERASHRTWLEGEGAELLQFGAESLREDGGFAWLDENGAPDLTRPSELWITCRMTHSFALGHLMGRPGLGRLAEHGVACLHGGWYSAVAGGAPVDDSKQAYAHAFVVLAASSALAAGRPGAEELLDEALEVLDAKFFDPAAGMSVDTFDRTFSECEEYRGINA